MTGILANDDAGKLVLRLTLGVLMLFHGIGKILDPGPLGFISGQLASHGLPAFVAYGVYLGEVLGPLMIVLGVFSRIGAVLVAGNMIFAIALVHTGDLLSLGKGGGWALELQGFYLLCGVALLFLGSGRYAVRPD